MKKSNKISRMISKIHGFPSILHVPLLSFVMGKAIPFVGTAKLKVEKLTPDHAVIRIRNRKPVQNHINSVHAAAIALIAETATGFMTALTVPDDRIMVLKSMSLNYTRRATGDMIAEARFSPEQLALIEETEKGEIDVPVTIKDSTGTETVSATMIWAWTKKKK